MVCAAEGKQEIAGSVGIDTTRPVAGQWRNHVYSCDYMYGSGRAMTLSVKELSNASETTAYFNMLGARLGQFGKPSSPRADVALSVAATIMGCWTGE